MAEQRCSSFRILHLPGNYTQTNSKAPLFPALRRECMGLAPQGERLLTAAMQQQHAFRACRRCI